MDDPGWEYRVVTLKIYNVNAMQDWLNDYGLAGWELITLSTTVKTWLNVTGNDLVEVMKRKSEKSADRGHVPKDYLTTPPGWHPDPMSRHEARWWDGTEWTEKVRDGKNEAPIR
jgi:hypothetical protein